MKSFSGTVQMKAMGWYFLVALFAMLLQNGSTLYVSRISLINKRHYVEFFDLSSLFFFLAFEPVSDMTSVSMKS